MSNATVTRRLQIIIDESGADKALERLTATEKKLIAELEKGTRAGKDMTKTLSELESVRGKIQSLEGIIGGKLAPTLRQTEAAARNLHKELKNMSEDAPGYAEKLSRFKEVSAQLDQMKQKVTGFRAAANSVFSQIKSVALGVTVGNTITAITQSITGFFGNAISGAAKLSDEISDIEKATNKTTLEAEALNSQLGKINTRTARSELRELAISLGQAGEEANTANVKALDQINVALGDEFESTKEIGDSLSILRNNLQDIKTGNYAEDVTHIGNALNELGANGLATAPVVTDIANRISGVGQTFGVTSGEILGTAAAFQELGISTERGSTAYTKLLQKMAGDAETFAKVAGVDLAEFKNLVNTNINEALLLVAKGSKEASENNVAFANTLQELESSGAGVSELLAKLAANGDLVRNKISLATKALKENDSILSEFDKKNNNLAARMEKLGKNIAAAFDNSAVRGAISDLIGWTADLFDETNKASRAFEDAQKQFDNTTKAIDPLYDRYVNLKSQTSLNKDEQAELAHIINQIAALVPQAATAFDQYGNAIDINTGKLNEWREGQKEFIQNLNRSAIESLQSDIDDSLARIVRLQERMQGAMRAGNEEQVKMFQTNIAKNQEIALKAGDELIDKYGVELPDKIFDGLNAIRVAIGQTARIANELKVTDPSLAISDASQFDIFLNKPSQVDSSVAAKRAALEAQIAQLKADYEKLNATDKAGMNANLKLREQLQKELDALDGKIEKGRVASARKRNSDLEELLKDLQKLERGIVLDKITDNYQKALAQLSDKYETFFARTQKNIALSKRVLEDFLKELQLVNAKYAEKDPGAPPGFDTKYDNSAELEAQLAANRAERLAKAELDSLNASQDQKLKLDLQFLTLQKNRRLATEKLTASEALLIEKEFQEKRHQLEQQFLQSSASSSLAIRLKSIAQVRDAEDKALKEQETAEILSAQKTGADINEIYARYTALRADNLRNAAIAMAQSVVESLQTAQQFASATNDLLNVLNSNRLNFIQEQHNQELNSFQNMLDQKVISQTRYNKLVNDSNKKFDREQREIQIKQFKRSQALQAGQAAISAALAVLNALSTVHPYPAAVAAAVSAGILGGIQVAAILAEKPPTQYETGGFLPKGSSHAEGGIGLRDNRTGRYVGEIEGGEPIISKGVYAANKPIIDALLAKGYKRDFTPITPGWMSSVPMRMNLPLIQESVSHRYASGGIAPLPEEARKEADQNNQLLALLLQRLNEPIYANVIYGEYEAKAKALENARQQGTIA